MACRSAALLGRVRSWLDMRDIKGCRLRPVDRRKPRLLATHTVPTTAHRNTPAWRGVELTGDALVLQGMLGAPPEHGSAHSGAQAAVPWPELTCPAAHSKLTALCRQSTAQATLAQGCLHTKYDDNFPKSCR